MFLEKLEAWQAAEDALKEYTVVGLNIHDFLNRILPTVGRIYFCQVNEETKTCEIL